MRVNSEELVVARESKPTGRFPVLPARRSTFPWLQPANTE